MEEYPIEQDNALIFHERVIEAQRLANLEIKSMNTKKGMLSSKDVQDAEEGDSNLYALAGRKRKGDKNFHVNSFARKRRKH